MRLGKDVLEADLYAELGVLADATASELRVAYRRQIRASHPDLNRENPDAMARTKRLNIAARVLLDAALRRDYDRARTAQAARPSSTPSARREWFDRRAQAPDGEWAAPASIDAHVHRSLFNGFFYELRGREGQLSLQVQELVESLSSRQQLSVAAFLFAMAMGLIGMAHAMMPERSEPSSAAMSTSGPRE